MIKINKIVWHEQLDIAGLAEGIVVTGVPLDHPMFKNQLTLGLNLCLADICHWKRINEMILRKRLLPVYYCLECNQIEDGNHRALATRVMGNKTLDIMLWSCCYQNNKTRMQAFENKIISGEVAL